MIHKDLESVLNRKFLGVLHSNLVKSQIDLRTSGLFA